MAGNVVRLPTLVCLLGILTIGHACMLTHSTPMTIGEHLYKADIVVLATFAEITPYNSQRRATALFNVLCVFKDDGTSVQAIITVNMYIPTVVECPRYYGHLKLGTPWIVGLTRTRSEHYSWHHMRVAEEAAWNYTAANIEAVASLCGLQNWTAPVGVSMNGTDPRPDCPNVEFPTTCISEGTGEWSHWEYQWNCQWMRVRDQWNVRPRWRIQGVDACEPQETQTLNCTCKSELWSELWSDWGHLSVNPCMEVRSRGEIHTIPECPDERLKRSERMTSAIPRQPWPEVSPCFEARVCEISITKPPCDDSFKVQVLTDLCAASVPKPTARNLRNVKDWGALCEDENDAIKSAVKCLSNYTRCTDNEAKALLSTGSHCFYIMMCDEGTLNPETQTMLDDARFDQALIDAIDFSPCLKLLNESSLELRELMHVPFLSCMRDFIEQARLTGPSNELARLMAQFLIDCAALIDDLGPTSEFYDFSSPRCNMRIWGEPHIETCNDTVTQTTCAAPGLQTYLDLFFIRITGINAHPTGRRSRITFLTEVTIEFKSLAPPHAITARYKAQNANFPTGFEFLAAPVSAIDTVTLRRRGFGMRSLSNQRIELLWPHTGIFIIMNMWGYFYQFTMRASQAVMNTGTGILIQGCPPDQVLYVWSIGLSRRRRNASGIRKRDEDEESALIACLTDGIPPDTADMDACKFDVIMTNDTAIAGATSMALADRDVAVSMDGEAIRNAGVWSLDIPAGPGFQYCVVGAEVDGCRDCVPNEFLLDPTNCSRYYQCLGYGKALRRKCSNRLRFNLAVGRCDWPWNVRCQVAPVGNGL